MRYSLPFALLLTLLLLGMARTGHTQEGNQTVAPTRLLDAPDSTADRLVVPVRIEHRGNDPLGSRLVLHLRERFNRSSLFRLSSGNEKTIKLLVTTREEFSGRPALSSIYAIVWLFSTGDGVLSHYLEQHVDFITQQDVEAQTEVLVARTDAVASNYGYLFE